MTLIQPYELAPGESAIVGYGSLMLRQHMELTLERPYRRSQQICHVHGWRRSWDVMMPNTVFFEERAGSRLVPRHILYLNVHADPQSMLAAVLVAVTQDDLQRFDAREWIYERQVLDPGSLEPSVTGGDVFIYVGRPEHLWDGTRDRSFVALRRTYLDVVNEGVASFGPSFRTAYADSTGSVPWDVLIDDQKEIGSHPTLAEKRPPHSHE